MIFERVTYIVQAAQYINVNTKDTLIDGHSINLYFHMFIFWIIKNSQ